MVALIRNLAAALVLLVGAAAAAPCVAATEPLDPKTVIERSEAAIGNRLGPHVLIDSNGAPLPLSQYRGRPLVISLVYTSCSAVCPVTTQHVLQAVETARGILGETSFAVLTIGFDARHDTPARLRAFAKQQGIAVADWRLASGDETTVLALLDDLGFSFEAAAGGFRHPTLTTIVDAQGRVYRHVYGDAFPDQVFIEPLKELVFGTTVRSIAIGDLVDRIKFICTVYNPSSGAYEFDYAIAFGIGIGGLSLILTGFVIFRLWRGNAAAAQAGRSGGQGTA